MSMPNFSIAFSPAYDWLMHFSWLAVTNVRLIQTRNPCKGEKHKRGREKINVKHFSVCWITYFELVVSVNDALDEAPDDFSAIFSVDGFCFDGRPRCAVAFFAVCPAFFVVVLVVVVAAAV